MNEEREKVRCVQCELVQWADHRYCRRCGEALPAPIVNVVERVVEKIVIRPDPECLRNLDQACRLISAASERLQESRSIEKVPVHLLPAAGTESFPSLEEVERAMLIAAYKRSNRKPVEAARLLGIGKTTFYRKLREMRQTAA
jgi:transcriptional regulator of acetoin/glycerol metabolism